ncbi:MAG: hypothetical protein QOD63_1424 [Actinomycetota bacterium]|nr:hypothetical protein [Actinomycetota bacterium]
MVDLNGLADKAKDLAAANADKIDDVVDKVANFAGDKLGHDKVAPVKDKVKSLIPRQEAGAAEPAEAEPAEEPAPEA